MSDKLNNIKDKLRVAILSGSTGDDPEELSRSRALAETYRDYLTSHGAEVDWMDMRDMGDMPDTYDWDTDWYDDYKKRLTDADAMVVSTPIFNYGPSGKVLQFLHRTLDKDNQQFKPYSLLSGAGSPRSALALGGLANQLDTEIKGIGIGGGVQVAGDEFDVESGNIDPSIISRANENAAKLLQVAEAMRSKTSSTHGSEENLVTELLKLAAKKKKPEGTATKRDPKKWSAAKSRAKAKMGGKWSARAAQLAVKYYKDSGGKYKGKKPSAKNNKLKKWTKQDWQWSGDRKKKSSVNGELVTSLLEFSKEAGKKKKKKGKGVYLPAKSIDALKSSEKGRKKLRAASRKKSKATREGEQHASHGLHEGKKRSKLGASDPNYRDRVALWLHDNAGNLLVQDDRDRGLGLKFPGGGIDPGQSVNDAAMREALEEVGYALADKPRAIPGVRAKKVDWDPVFSAEAAAKGRNYLGSKHYHRVALAGEPDESLLGSEGDALKANWMPIEEVLEATRSAAANPDNKYNYFDEERLRAAEKVYEILTQKTSSYQSPYLRAYLVGVKLAHADFNDNDNVEDGLNTHDNEVYHKVKAEDFVSPEDHGNMTPNTNDFSYGQTKNDEVVPEEEEGSIYQTTKIERRERHG